MKQLVFVCLSVFVCLACSRQEDVRTLDPGIAKGGIRPVSIESALATLDDFMVKSSSSETRVESGAGYTIASITTYKSPSTRAVETEDLAKAYIVNFANDQGFAILGANTAMPDVLIVSSMGQIDTNTFKVVVPSFLKNPEHEANTRSSEAGETGSLPPSVFREDLNDFYTASELEDAATDFLTVIVENALMLEYNDAEEYVGGCTPTPPNPGDGETPEPDLGGNVLHPDWNHQWQVRSPLLNYSWSQGYLYNTYCYRAPDVRAYTGCSATAMGMIVAYNEFPADVQLNGVDLNWDEMKSSFKIKTLSSVGRECVALLLGYIYNSVNKWPTEAFTLIFPSEIKVLFERMGYTNVCRTVSNTFSHSMLDSISEMLSDNKPVFFSSLASGLPDAFKEGHSWVIDGAQYSSGGCYLLHFNWGWEGTANGYFHYAVINPTMAHHQDSPGEIVPENKNIDYTWYYQMITYDCPETDTTFHETFDY